MSVNISPYPSPVDYLVAHIGHHLIGYRSSPVNRLLVLTGYRLIVYRSSPVTG